MYDLVPGKVETTFYQLCDQFDIGKNSRITCVRFLTVVNQPRLIHKSSTQSHCYSLIFIIDLLSEFFTFEVGSTILRIILDFCHEKNYF